MGKRILLVEGRDDQHAIANLCRSRGIDISQFEIKTPSTQANPDEGGIDSLLELIPVLLKSSDLERLCVVVDADEDSKSRWHSLVGLLKRSGFTDFPMNPGADGLSIICKVGSRSCRLAIWLMPNNSLSGTLETFLAYLINVDDDILPFVDRMINEIPIAQRRFSPNRLSKARIHSYLALQEFPGKPLGIAISSRYLNGNDSRADTFIDWLNTHLIN